MATFVFAVNDADAAVWTDVGFAFAENGCPITVWQNGEAWKGQMAVANGADCEVFNRLAAHHGNGRLQVCNILWIRIIGGCNSNSSDVGIEAALCMNDKRTAADDWHEFILAIFDVFSVQRDFFRETVVDGQRQCMTMRLKGDDRSMPSRCIING